MIIEFDTKYRSIMRDCKKWHISWMHVFTDYETIFQEKIRHYVYKRIQDDVMIKICTLLSFNIGIEIENFIYERLRK